MFRLFLAFECVRDNALDRLECYREYTQNHLYVTAPVILIVQNEIVLTVNSPYHY